MGARGTLGGILIVLGVALLIASVYYFFAEDPVEVVGGVHPDSMGATAGAAGTVFLLGGIVLLALRLKARVVVPARPVANSPQVAIKRTDMTMAGPTASAAGDELQAQLESVNQKLARAKVQLGMGQISSETYQRLAKEYGEERSAIEKKIFESQRS